MWVLGSNSGPHACEISTSPTHLSPQPLYCGLWRRLSSGCDGSWVIKNTQIWSTQDSWWLDSWDDEVTKTKQEENKCFFLLAIKRFTPVLSSISLSWQFWVRLKSAGSWFSSSSPGREEASRWPWGSRRSFSFLFTPGLSLLLHCSWLVQKSMGCWSFMCGAGN